MFLLRVLSVAGQFRVPDRIDGSATGILVLLVLGLPVLGLGVLAVWYWRTRIEVRRRELAPPLYLLTLIGATSNGETTPPTRKSDHDDLELDRGRRLEIAALRRRATRLLFAVGVDAVVVWLAAAWYVREVRTPPDRFGTAQTFAVMEPRPAAETLTTDLGSSIPHRFEVPSPPPVRAQPEQEPIRTQEPVRTQETVRAQAPARETAAPVPATAGRTSPPGPPRATVAESPPAPSPERIDRAPVAEPEVLSASPEAARPDPAVSPPPPDPAVARAAAERALGNGVRYLVAELNARRGLGESDPDATRRLTEWLRSQRPSAAAGALDDIVVEGSHGEAVLPVTLRWRDDFGVGKQRAVRFRIAVDRQGDNWVFAGAELLERFP